MVQNITIKLTPNIYDGMFRGSDGSGDKKLLKNIVSSRELVSLLQKLNDVNSSSVVALLLREALRILPIAFFRSSQSNDASIKLAISQLTDHFDELYLLLISLSENIKNKNFDFDESAYSGYREAIAKIYCCRDLIYRPVGVFTYKSQTPSYQFYPLTLFAAAIEAYCSLKLNPAGVFDLCRIMFFSYAKALNVNDCCSHYEIHKDMSFIENGGDVTFLLNRPLWSGFQFMESRIVEVLIEFGDECEYLPRDVVKSYSLVAFGDFDYPSYQSILLIELKRITPNKEIIPMIYTFSFPDFSDNNKSITLSSGQIAFVVGENGSGKSALMHHFYKSNAHNSKRIFAHRKILIKSNVASMTDVERNNAERNIIQSDMNSSARYSDHNADQKLMLAIFDLVRAETSRAFQIAQAHDSGNQTLAAEISRIDSPIKIINSVFFNARIPIEISIASDSQIFASKNRCPKYSIIELSDGEKNALLMSIEILTAKPEGIIIIDEPEIHLHSSISSPLLSDLFSRRPDCSYIISTHDLELLGDSSAEKIIVIRNCQWNSGEAVSWDANIIESPRDIDNDVKASIKGGRKTILFVEGKESGRDVSIYSILFPAVSIIACGNCTEVKNSVRGMQGVQDLTWLNPLGLIDSDGQVSESLGKLQSENIFALPFYAIESLYYNKSVIAKIIFGFDPKSVSIELEKIEAIIKVEASSLKTHMCAMVCEKRARAEIMANLPKKADILEGGTMPAIPLDYDQLLNTEYIIFDNLIENNIFGIIGRYKIKSLTQKIAAACGYKSDQRFEQAVRALIRNDNDLRAEIRATLGAIVPVIDSLGV